ncbi:PPOX class F420-dependent oxidoreductase [Cryptosporangium phraense]|uniref:PPOX class F420-dependent oxidoreductase n=1 Tax=Cryptosporangium phraense TaxID=2593070 RepID=A0A545AT26_9ACTN|nr:PPOX class F420-dependent oxidoreductase [Cryptosporangium phraense]TQS44452.1 PPOX class F420-dependent oxidoreductase [Cryptosporangium phraense]
MPIFTDAELAYLSSQRLARLATVDARGVPQNSPVGYSVDPDTGAIDIGGYHMGASRKFRNVRRSGKAAFVVDDIASVSPWRVRGIEIRGDAEAIDGLPAQGHLSGEIIRVHPRWILSWGLDGQPPRGSRRL